MDDLNTLHVRIAKALGWLMKDTQSFSLQSLRELVRPISPKLVHEINLVIQMKEVNNPTSLKGQK